MSLDYLQKESRTRIVAGNKSVMRMGSRFEEIIEDVKSSNFGGGVQDAYGEDCATEDHLVTPWTVSVARFQFLFTMHAFIFVITILV